jgi:hypothetical protein
MPDFSLVPVDHQPDFSDISLVPVDHDPFSADGAIQQAGTQPESPPQQLALGADQPELGAPVGYGYAKSAPTINMDRVAAAGTPMPRGADLKQYAAANDNTPPGFCRPLPSFVLPGGNRACLYLCPDGSMRRLEIMTTFSCPPFYY